jgi:glycine betaine/proline transport system substrate-binding protein
MRRRRTRLLAAGSAAALAAALALSGCGAATSSGGGSAYEKSGQGKTVSLVVNSWTGSQANVAVAGYLLEKELGYTVEEVQIDEVPGWQALASGKADAILENWGHEDLKKTYIAEQKSAVSAGPLGIQGHIGWYVPKYLAEKHPDITDWRNLDKYADELRTPESGSKGQFLGGSPSYVTNDPALIKNLDLNYKVVYAGSEAAEIAQIRKAYESEEPLLFYWYTPQWLGATYEFEEVKLPPYKPGCDTPLKQVDCAYPTYTLDKILSKQFVDEGGAAVEFLKKFRWSTEDQNQVALYIAQDKMSPEQAAKRWAEEHRDVWKRWMPS